MDAYCCAGVLTVDGGWETHHDYLGYAGYEVEYPDDDLDELELQEVLIVSCAALFTLLHVIFAACGTVLHFW